MNKPVHAKFGMGAPVRRLEDAAFITGKGRYTDDWSAPGMLHGYVLRSPHANASFTIGDLEAARAHPGVHLVLVAADMVRAAGDEIVSEHVSIVLGPGFVISFQEGRSGALFDPLRARIRAGNGRVRAMGPDYLAHALLDAIVDGYFGVVEKMEEGIDRAEAEAIDERTTEFPKRIYGLKSELTSLRQSVVPLREVLARLLKGESRLIGRGVHPYLRDLSDHVMQVLDMVDSGRERLNGVLELHLAVQSHRMNDVMRVLTVVSTVFIPMSWLAGVYGMNFDDMPELHVRFGYFAAMGVMVGMALAMLAWFRYRKWL